MTYTVGIQSIPEGADIYIDGSWVGITGMTLILGDGNHSLLLEKIGYEDYYYTIIQAEDAGTNLWFTLTSTGLGYIRGTVVDDMLHLPLVFVNVSFGPFSTSTDGNGYFILELTEGYSGYLTFSLSTYQTREILLTASPGDDIIVGSIEMSRISPSQINIYSTPSGANSFLDNTIWCGETPVENFEVDPKTYELELYKDDYLNYYETFSISEGETKNFDITLEPTGVTWGTLNIYSTPPGAIVYVDDNWAGPTPIESFEYPTGTHTLKLVLENLIHEEIFTLAEGETKTFNISFPGIQVTINWEAIVEEGEHAFNLLSFIGTNTDNTIQGFQVEKSLYKEVTTPTATRFGLDKIIIQGTSQNDALTMIVENYNPSTGEFEGVYDWEIKKFR